MPLRFRSQDQVVYELFEASGRNVRRATALLAQLLDDYPERAHLSGEIVVCEHDGDRLTHDIIHRLNAGSRVPLDPFDGLTLAKALDDIVDFTEETSDALALYRVEAPMEQAGELADVLAAAGDEVSSAVTCLRSGNGLAAHLAEIHRLEHEGDRLSRGAVAALFATGVDPMVLIRWKDIFGSLESSVDACQAVANIIEGITLKRR